MQKLKKTSHAEVHITEISQSIHDRKAGHMCRMTKKGHILIDLVQFKSSLNNMQI